MHCLIDSALFQYKFFFRRSDLKKLQWWKFCILGLLDGSSDLLRSVGGVYTSGTAQNLLSQLNIVSTMLVSFWLLHARYRWQQVLGAVLIIGGAVVGLLHTTNAHDMTANNANQWWALLIFASNVVPAGWSVSLKELFFKKNFVDVFQLTCFVSWSQLALTWVYTPLLAIKGFGGVPMKSVDANAQHL